MSSSFAPPALLLGQSPPSARLRKRRKNSPPTNNGTHRRNCSGSTVPRLSVPPINVLEQSPATPGRSPLGDSCSPRPPAKRFKASSLFLSTPATPTQDEIDELATVAGTSPPSRETLTCSDDAAISALKDIVGQDLPSELEEDIVKLCSLPERVIQLYTYAKFSLMFKSVTEKPVQEKRKRLLTCTFSKAVRTFVRQFVKDSLWYAKVGDRFRDGKIEAVLADVKAKPSAFGLSDGWGAEEESEAMMQLIAELLSNARTALKQKVEQTVTGHVPLARAAQDVFGPDAGRRLMVVFAVLRYCLGKYSNREFWWQADKTLGEVEAADLAQMEKNAGVYLKEDAERFPEPVCASATTKPTGKRKRTTVAGPGESAKVAPATGTSRAIAADHDGVDGRQKKRKTRTKTVKPTEKAQGVAPAMINVQVSAQPPHSSPLTPTEARTSGRRGKRKNRGKRVTFAA